MEKRGQEEPVIFGREGKSSTISIMTSLHERKIRVRAIAGEKGRDLLLSYQYIISSSIVLEESMSRQTISVSDEIWMALKEISMKRKKPMGKIIEESLVAYGIKPRKNAMDLLKMAQERSSLSEEAALALSVEEVRRSRRR